ncbi:MAG: hypothetical protein U0746_08100 [Gemmataceae bacterium]
MSKRLQHWVTSIDLERAVYDHGLPEKYTIDKPLTVDFDNVVIATERIGCLAPPKDR